MLRSREARLPVENRLDPGSYRFALTVVDDDGNESAPVQLGVTVIREPVVVPVPGDIGRVPPISDPGPVRRPPP